MIKFSLVHYEHDLTDETDPLNLIDNEMQFIFDLTKEKQETTRARHAG